MEVLKDILNKRQLRATPARLSVLGHVKRHKGAMPFSLLQRKMLGTDRITLFRTLKSLLDSGIVHKANFENDETYYAICPDTCTAISHSHDHVHFKCTSCSKVTCEQLPESALIKLPHFKISKIDINVTGVCMGCA